MKLLAKQNRELIMINTQNTQNENDVEKIIIQVPEQYQDFNKKIVFVTPNGVVWDIIINNEYLIKKAISKYEQVDFYLWLTKEDVDFRTQTKTLKFYHNSDASNEITDEEIGAVNTYIAYLDSELIQLDTRIATAEELLQNTINAKEEAETLIASFDTDVTEKTDTFNQNATEKNEQFNLNATNKTTMFNENAIAKTNEFDENAESYAKRITELEEMVSDDENVMLKAPANGESMSLNDSAEHRVKKIEIFGNSKIKQQIIESCTLINLKIVNNNIFDEQMEIGNINPSTGENRASTLQIRSVNFIDINNFRKVAIVASNNSVQTAGLRFYDKNKRYLGSFASVTNDIKDIDSIILNNTTSYYTKNSDIYYLRFVITTSTDLNIKYAVIVNDTNYVKHKGQSIVISTQLSFRAVHNTRDCFVKENNIWYEKHNIEYIENYNGETITTDYISTTGELSLGASVQYVLTEPEMLECTQEQITVLETLQKAKTYKNITHIYSEDEVPAHIDLIYYRDLETVINNLSNEGE